MRKLLRSMKKNRIKKIGRSVVTVSLAAGLAAGAYLGMADNAQAFDPSTTTVGLSVVTDKDAITSGTVRTVNIGIMGLDELGNVDINGTAGGSTIIASVTSVLGTVAGNTNPDNATTGSLAAQTRYVKLVDGIGETNIAYKSAVEGTDTVTVRLYEMRNDVGQGGSVETREISSKTLNISVAAAESSAGILDIASFTGPSGTEKPSATCGDTGTSDACNPGLSGDDNATMTVGTTGATFVVKAYRIKSDRTYEADTTASGEVTITLTGLSADQDGKDPYGNVAEGQTYTLTGTMNQGVANVTVSSTSLTKAGKYRVVATMGDISSVPQTAANNTRNSDYITLLPKAIVRKVGLEADMSTVLVKGADFYEPAHHQATVKAYLLDEFGNKVKAAHGDFDGTTIKFTDANSKVSISSTDFDNDTNFITAPVTADSTGAASITAEVKDSTLIQASDPLTIKVVANGFRIKPISGQVTYDNATTVNNATAGSPYNLLTGEHLYLTDNATFSANAPIDVYDNGTRQTARTSTDGDSDNSTNLSVLMRKAGTIGTYFISDPDGEIGSMKIRPESTTKINPATPTVAKLTTDIDGAGDVLTVVPAAANADGTFKATVNLQHFNLYDTYGNENNTGATVRFITTRGTVTGNSQSLGADNNTVLNYPAGTTGEDTLSFTFGNAPGVSADNINNGDGIKVSIPAIETLNEFAVYPETTDPIVIPINGIAILDIYPRSENGKPVPQDQGFKISYDPTGIQLTDTSGTSIITGTLTGQDKSRYGVKVTALTTPGTYTINIESADASVSKSVEVQVREYTVPLSLGDATITVAPGASETVAIIGGTAPFTVASGDENIVTASVDGNSVVLNAVAVGGPVEVTVTDSVSNTATVNVTVSESAGVPDLGPSYGLDGDGNSITTETSFTGGVSVAGGSYTSQATVGEGDQVNIQLTVSIDPAHQGQAADMIALVGYKPDGGVLSWFIKPASDTENWVQWYGDLAELTPFTSSTGLNSEETMNIYTGALIGLGGGTIQAYGAYRLEDGTLVWNQQPVIINVTQ